MKGRRNIYPKYMTVTDEGKALYGIWRRIQNHTDKYGVFADYPKFFSWAMDNFYVLGSRLRRYDEHQPFSPNNCTFESADPKQLNVKPELRALAQKWNKTVNVFRKAYGMELFDEDELSRM